MLGFHVAQTEFIQRECNDRRLKDGLRQTGALQVRNRHFDQIEGGG